MQNAIELKNVTKRLGDFKLGPITMSVPKGCIVGYIGENGAGKSTTVKLLLGLMKPDEGKIELLGKDIGEVKPGFYKDIAFVFDDLHLPGDMKLKQVRTFHKKLYREAWQDEKFLKLIEHFGLPEDKALKNFSRGMKMQLSLVLALSHGAKLLLLDEPTSGLDPVIRDDFLDLLLDYIQDEDNTVLVSTHILSDLEKAADYIAFIHKGRLMFMEAKDELTEKYGMVSLSKEQFESLDSEAVIGKREYKFGTEVLIKRDMIPDGVHVEKVGIEDIMIYMIKGERK